MQSIHIYVQPIAMHVSAHVQCTHVASEPGQITSISALTGKLCVLVAFRHVLIWIPSADQPSPGQLWPGLASNPIPPGTPNKVPSWLALSISAPC